MKRFIFVLLAVLTLTAVCTPCVCAYDIASEQAEAFGTAALESALPAQTYDAFGTLTVADAAHPRPLLQKLWDYALREGGGALASAARNAALLLAVVFLAALCASLSASGACAKVTQMTGTVAVAALSVTHVTSCITAGSSALTTLRDFSKILLPSMCAAAAASGAATSAAAKYAATSLFLDILLSAETAVLLPMLYTYAGTVICGAALEQDVLTALSALLRKALRLLLIGFAAVFTLYLSLTGILTGSADAAAAKAVKTAVSAALPVVGSIVADAAATVTASAAILRGGIGIIGVMSVAAVCVTPYLQLAVHYALYMLGFVDLGCIVEKAAEENDLAGWRILLEAARQTDAVLLRHADIQQSDVRLDAGLAQMLQQLFRVSEIGNIGARCSQRILYAFDDLTAVQCVVIAYDDVQHACAISLRLVQA